jgi:hypothetical protein
MSVGTMDHNHIHTGLEAAVSGFSITLNDQVNLFRFHIRRGTAVMVVQLDGSFGPVSLDNFSKPIQWVYGFICTDMNGITGMNSSGGCNGTAVPYGHNTGPSPRKLSSPFHQLTGYISIACPQMGPHRWELNPVFNRDSSDLYWFKDVNKLTQPEPLPLFLSLISIRKHNNEVNEILKSITRVGLE